MSEVGAPLRCVIGDDHEVVRGGVITFLARQDGIEIAGEAADGASVLRLLEEHEPDVAVVDLKMPELDGIDVCREVVARGLPTAVVIYTAFSEAQVVEEALEAGARGFVLKASPTHDLVRAILHTRTGQVYIDATIAADLLRFRSAVERELLTPREREVLQLLAQGLTTDSVGRTLFLSPTTVRSYADNAMHKLESRNRTEAVAKALRRAIIQ